MSVETPSRRVLDPVERVSEILFGLIMALTFTCSISAATAGQEEVREVLVGAVGCNLAWGLVDAVMYLVTIMVQRSRGHSIALAVRASKDPQHGRQAIADALPEPLEPLFDEAEIEHARAKLIASPDVPVKTGLVGRDWIAALGVFLLVSVTTFPVVLPFLFVSPLSVAMRVSNGVAIVMMYLAGHSLARHAGLGPVRMGLAMVALGVVLVLITIALGG